MNWHLVTYADENFVEQLTPVIPPQNENPIRRTFDKLKNWLYGE